jgi:hypothetical protein
MDTRFAALISRVSTGKLALAVKVTPTTVSKWKAAAWLPRPQYYESIASACKLTVDEIAAAVSSDHIERYRARRAANLTSPSQES